MIKPQLESKATSVDIHKTFDSLKIFLLINCLVFGLLFCFFVFFDRKQIFIFANFYSRVLFYLKGG